MPANHHHNNPDERCFFCEAGVLPYMGYLGVALILALLFSQL